MTELHVRVADDIAEQLAAVAAQRGVSAEDLAADVLTQHAPTVQEPASTTSHRFAFVGIGSSGRSDLSERVEEILTEDFGR